ncbi:MULTISPECIES: autotransporter assembly complex family protein [unclassified Iodidimonas]|uniref:autotransporter assembly complex protein TamA n=1 Tax=unclassified Iodidimonas TaxID=2626145 RepID=UPI002482D2B9|nr:MULTISPECIES: autotransporter assembly complex family protein [unclassified Iodidimonas]
MIPFLICKQLIASIFGQSHLRAQVMALAALMAVSAFAGPLWAQAAPSAESPAISYQLKIEGVENGLKDQLTQLSVLNREKSTPPRSYGALRTRIERDLKSFQKALRSWGYYNATLTDQIDSSQSPVKIAIIIFPGPLYKISDISLNFIGSAPDETLKQKLFAEMSLKPGDPARAAAIVNGEDHIAKALPINGHPLAQKATRRVVIDHASSSAAITYRFEPGPEVHYGSVLYEGLKSVDEEYLDRLVPWKPGEPYDQASINRFRQALVSSRLFGSVRINFKDPPSDLRQQKGPISPPLEINLVETNHRTIAIGAGFTTTEGFGGDLSWEHRNLLGSQERLTLNARIAEIEQSLIADFQKPHFLRHDQYLTVRLGAIREDTDAFDSLELNARLGLDRAIGRYWRLGVGTELGFTSVEEIDDRRTFLLTSLPLNATFDQRDSLLDATQGVHARLAIAPHLAEQSGLFSFYKMEFDASSYLALDQQKNYILAGRVALGSIIGAETDRLPANRRFFAGGGGSVRGFGFQDVGPLNAEGDPLGGRSKFEASVEARVKISKSIGIVPFVDAGEITGSTTPQFEDLRWGAGIGFRYHTSFAPVRIDLATPINRRPGDNRIQLYISLGQSF